MKMRITVKWIKEGTCEIEVPDSSEILGGIVLPDRKAATDAIEALTHDDFITRDEYHEIEILNEQGDDIEGFIQPHCPKLN